MKRIFTSVMAACVLLLAVVSPASAQWSIVGSAGLSNSVANFTAMAVDGNHTPYIAYSDNSQGDKLTVEKFNGTGWVTVGGAGVSSGSAEHLSIAIDGSNNIYVGFRDGANSGKATVMKYNGSTWSIVGGAGLSAGQAYYVSVAVNAGGTVYVAYQDQTKGGKATVEKLTGSSWAPVGTTGFTSGQADYVSMDIDGPGNLYISYRDNNLSWKARVMKYNGSSWATLGTAGFSSGGVSEIDMAIDANNKPYVVYVDWNSSNKATVQAYNGSSWSVVGSAGFSANGVGKPTIATDANNTPYVVYRDDGNNQKATVMTYNGSTWAAVTTAGFSSNTVDYTSIATDPNDNTIYVGFKDNAVSQKATVMKHAGAPPVAITWTGNSSKDWNTAGNWSTSAVPSTSENVKIPAGRSRYPELTTGSSYCKKLEILSGASVTVNGGKLFISGAISNDGTLNAENGTIVLNGSAVQSVPAGTFTNNTVNILELDNNAGCTLEDTLNIKDTYIPTSGTLTTNDKLVLKSTASKTARVAAGSYLGNYLNGKVTIEQYVPGRRAFRFLSHPFGNPIPLSQLMDDIDITGDGGTVNGFTAVQVNAPSAFWFDVFSADNTTQGNNPGWKDYKSTIPASWERYQMARIFIRGSHGQGLDNAPYVPNAVTLDMTGELSQGDKLIGLDKGSNSSFVICSNPYASPVDMKKIIRTRLSSNFVVWDPSLGQRGAYAAYQFSTSYILPAYTAFVTTVTSGNKGFADFRESHKSGNTPAALFKTTTDDFRLELSIEDSTISWDRLLIDFDSIGMVVQDTFDMVKLNNPDVDFYTLSDDNQPLSIDVRPYEENKTIKLGFMPYMEKKFVLKVPALAVPAGVKLMLTDKFLNKTEELKEGMEYWFDATSDTTTYGEDRFAINMVGDPNGISVVNNKGTARMQLMPNPAQNTVKVSFDKIEGKAAVQLMDISGRTLFMQNLTTSEGSISIPLTSLPAGIYIVELNGANTRIIEKLVKQ